MILDDGQRRALQFIKAANQGGAKPTDKQVTEWIQRPNRMPGKKGRLLDVGSPSAYGALLAQSSSVGDYMSQFLGLSPVSEAMKKVMEDATRRSPATLTRSLWRAPRYGLDGPRETLVKQLVRLEWVIQDDQGSLILSRLGLALLKSDTADDDDAAWSVVLEPDSPLSYAQLVGHIADRGEVLIVDPYMRGAQLFDLVKLTDTKRMLVGDLGRKDLAEVRLVLAGATEIEVRQVERRLLHDRCIIAADGVDSFGTSMNGVGKSAITTLVRMTGAVAERLREVYEEVWSGAETIESAEEFPVTPSAAAVQVSGVAEPSLKDKAIEPGEIPRNGTTPPARRSGRGSRRVRPPAG